MTAHATTLFDGNTVIVCRTRHATNPADRETFALDDVARSSVPSMRSALDHIRNFREVGSIKAPVGAKRRALEQFLQAQSPDVMLIEQGQEAKFFWLSAKRLGIPVFVYFRGIDATGYLRPGRQQPNRIRSYRRMMKRIDGIFAVSQFLVDELAGHGITHPVTHVIPSGVETARFVPGDKRPRDVLMAGRLIDKKAPLVSIGAFISASASIADAHLHIVGDGPRRLECENLVRRQGAQSKVTFHGYLEHQQVAQMMATIPLFIQHSVTSKDNDKEGAPTSIQEAMACGMCVVSTRHAGIPNLIKDGVTGFLVDEHDDVSFAERIHTMLSNPLECLEVGRHARRIAERELDKPMLHRRLESILQEHAKGRG
ncbi:MAG: glycosyltransferase [Pseudomonadota bacterium]